VSEEEIDFVLDRIRRSINQPEYEVSEIFLPVDSPDQDEQVRQNAERLVAQIRRGASFPAVARQFSQSPSAAAGGDLGWVQDGQLPDELNDMLRRLAPGQFSLPVRSTGGYYVLALRDRRITGATDPSSIVMTLRQIVVPVTGDMTDDQIRQAGELAYRVSESVESCEQMREIALTSPLMVGGDIGTRRLTELREQFQQALQGLSIGSVSPPIPSEVGFHVVYVCDRSGGEANLPSRQAIEDQLYQQQLASIARRHLRDLRRDALIDIREGSGG
jgi:peptidyl-prolyl cis-trans isomerase SurA